MSSEQEVYDAKVEPNESEIALQTIERPDDTTQFRQPSKRALAALLPIFQRSPAPSPPSSEELFAFQEEQKLKIVAACQRSARATRSHPDKSGHHTAV